MDTNQNKISGGFLIKMNNLIINLYGKKISRIVRTILQRNSKSGEFTSNLKLLQSYSKKVCYVCKYTYRYKYFQIDIQKTIILKSQEVSHYKTN